MRSFKLAFKVWLLAAVFAASNATAQTTQFTYQGKLTDNGATINALYDFVFTLWDAPTNGNQIGSPVSVQNTAVVDGIFTVKLDFGAGAFNGGNRFLEISVKQTGNPGSPTLLSPRQQVISTPYAIKSLGSGSADGLSAACVNCITSSQIGSVNGSAIIGGISGIAISGPIPVGSVPAGSTNYIQNTTTQQASSDFNISGNGTAGGTLAGNVVNATTQYNLNGARILSNAGNNLFAGIDAGQANTSGSSNTFVGTLAGKANSTGFANTFVGYSAGTANFNAINNSFFGQAAGFKNISGQDNTFIGNGAGLNNTTASNNTFVGAGVGLNSTGGANSFFGASAGLNNTADGNAFFGYQAGQSNTSGSLNIFVGTFAGKANLNGSANTFVGHNAGAANNGANNNSFFGQAAGFKNISGQDNTFIGNGAGLNNTAASNNTFVGAGAGLNSTGHDNAFFGWLAGSSNTASANNFFGANAGAGNTSGGNNAFFGTNAGILNTTGSSNTIIGAFANVSGGSLSFATAIGANAIVSNSNTIALGRNNGVDKVVIPGLGIAGATALCRNVSNEISVCSSSLRYKNKVQTFTGGLNIINRLRPISFSWKDGGMRDVGFAAEEVEKIEPLLTFRNKEGEIEGVKYGQITAVLVNAIKEQQAQIASQQEQLKKQQSEIALLKRLVYRRLSK